MALAKCSFCGVEQEDFYGSYLIKNDGTIQYYCSQKCIKNTFKLGRDRRKLKWTMAFHEARGKKIAKHEAAVAAEAKKK